MGFIRGLLKTLIVLLVLLVVVGLFLPASTTVSRSLVVKASPEKVFSLVNGFSQFNKFSPWHNADPQTRYRYSGPATGVGARMEWDSDNPNVGRGSNQIIAVEQNRKVTTRLDFGAPGDALAWFALEPLNTDTKITWGLRSDAGFDLVARYFNLLLDYFVGKDYERGLRQLKILAEANPVATVSESGLSEQGVQLQRQPQQEILLLSGHSGQDFDAISAALGVAYAQLGVASQAAGVKPVGAPYISRDYWTDAQYVFTVAVQVSGVSSGAVPVGVELQRQPPRQFACAYHEDNADKSASTYQQVIHWIADQGYLVTGPAREHYSLESTGTSAVQPAIQVCVPVTASNGQG